MAAPDIFAESGIKQNSLLDGRLTLWQPERGYRSAIDPVLLAAAVPAVAGDRVLDVGTGVGTAALCLALRQPECQISGLEIQPELAALALRNAEDNGCAERLAVLVGDLAKPPSGLRPGFDHVMANPPHQAASRGPPSPYPGKALANREGASGLADWLDFCLTMVAPGGSVTVIHRADRLDEVLGGLASRSGATVVIPLWPKAGEAAKRVVVQVRRGAKTPLRLAPGLVLHEADGSATAAAQELLRDAGALVA